MKYVLLARFSPRPDAAESESNDTQLRDLREHVAKQGGEIVAEFADSDLSGDDEDRAGLWHAVSALRKGYVLLVWKADRLARSVYLSEMLHRDVKAAGARIECLHGSTDDSNEGILIRQVMAAFHEYEKKASAARTKHTMLSLQKSGRCMGGIPFGYKAVPCDGTTKRGNQRRKLVQDPKQQAILRRIHDLAAEGHGSFKIRALLAEEGYEMNRSTIEKLLTRSNTVVNHKAEPAGSAAP